MILSLTAILFGLAASSPHYNIPLAMRPHPSWKNRISIRLTANVEFNFSHAPSLRNRFSICITVNVNFYFSYPPSQQNQFPIRPMANVNFIFLPPPRGNISFTLHGGNRFSLHLTARIKFILPSRGFAPHGGIRCSLCLTVRIGFILPIRQFVPDCKIDFLSPHGNNQFFFASRWFFAPLRRYQTRLSSGIKRTNP